MHAFEFLTVIPFGTSSTFRASSLLMSSASVVLPIGPSSLICGECAELRQELFDGAGRGTVQRICATCSLCAQVQALAAQLDEHDPAFLRARELLEEARALLRARLLWPAPAVD